MFTPLDPYNLRQHRPKLRNCSSICTVLSVTFGFITVIMLLAIFAVDMTQRVYVVYVHPDRAKFMTDEKFLSIALDSSTIASGFKQFNLTDERIIKLMKALSPAYLRIGGTMADRLIFTLNESHPFKFSPKQRIDGGECAYDLKFCDYLDYPNFTMSAREWVQLNELARNTNLRIIFDLNVLRRFANNTWNPSNAEQLIRFSNRQGFSLDWELGNEPESFRHQFNFDVNATQLAKDFQTLDEIVRKYRLYSNSLLVGPDVTRPQPTHNSSMLYLREFLAQVGDTLNAITFHQYYLNGATAKISDFMDPENFDLLKWQINVVQQIKTDLSLNKPVWLGETSSAYAGGAPHLSDRYVATFLWLDKLGVAAKYGVDVVVRQTIFQGNYALINNEYNPTPDWWVSVLYKKLVGREVVDCHTTYSWKVRLYCHCTPGANTPSITVFGVNLYNRKVKIRIEGTTLTNEDDIRNLKVDAYILSTVDRIDSRYIYLNGERLELTQTHDVPKLLPKTVFADPYVEMPAFSLGFWVFPIAGNVLTIC